MEISLFIQSAAGILDDFPSIINKEVRGESTVLDMKYLIYCLHIMIPVLLEMFGQFSNYSSSKFHMEIITAQSSNLFCNLFDPVKTHTEIFIQRYTMVAVSVSMEIVSMEMVSIVTVITVSMEIVSIATVSMEIVFMEIISIATVSLEIFSMEMVSIATVSMEIFSM